MEAILKGSSQRGWKTTTSTVNDPSPCSLHSTSKESQNSSFPSLRICWPIVTDTASLATSRCTAFLDVREFGFEVALSIALGSIFFVLRGGGSFAQDARAASSGAVPLRLLRNPPLVSVQYHHSYFLRVLSMRGPSC